MVSTRLTILKPAANGSIMPVTVRPARSDDAAAIAEIYNQGIRGRQATFETAERRTADLAAWFEPATLARYPLLVAIDAASTTDESVLGWVHASAYRPRACYAGIGDFSVYVHEDARGRGVGDALMAAFLPACAERGLWKVLSRIFPENLASRRLCARHGFREVGVYERHAQLDGVWRDVVIVERLITVATVPTATMPMPQRPTP